MSFNFLSRVAFALGLTTSLLMAPSLSVVPSFAQVYNGPGLEQGLNEAKKIEGPIDRPLRETVLRILRTVLSYMALIAVIAIIIAGIYLVVSGGSDDAKNKAKNIIIYTAVGLIIIALARLIVSFVIGIIEKA